MRALSLSLSHSLSHSPTRALSVTLAHSRTLSHALSLPHSHTPLQSLSRRGGAGLVASLKEEEDEEAGLDLYMAQVRPPGGTESMIFTLNPEPWTLNPES